MDFWQLAIAIASLAIAIGVPVIARDRSLMAMIGDAKEAARRAATDVARELHERVNRVREEYVRRDDLDGHLQRIDQRINELRADQRAHAEEQRTALKELAEGQRTDMRELKQMVNSLAGRLGPVE